jgi:putative peptide zinc metalloprotease protein
MSTSLFSPSWYRVANLRPRLRSHLEIHRHHYRGELWYVLQDHASGRFQRFTPTAYKVIGLMNGKQTVQEIWDRVRADIGEEAPSQEEVVRLLSQLHAIDALQTDVMPDTAELMKRFEKHRHGKWKQNLKSPLFMRFPLLDPESLLLRFQWLVRPFFSWAGAILWLLVVGWAVFEVGVHWPELTKNITDRILAPKNLVILWLVFPFLKAFHEFGHGFAVNLKGGEVHEMGIMFLVFTPIPYVDASSASAFREKHERVLVGAAGMAVEIFIAALAVFVWINAEPGPVRAVAFNVIFIAGVSSVLFNGNPLLRYDAYYILTDLLEIPNLASRGIRYVFYLFQKYLLGARNVEAPLSTKGEHFWFMAYTITSFFYRMFIYVAIILFVATKFFFIGVLFACWGLTNMFVWPAIKGMKFLLTSPRLVRKRFRALVVTAGVLAVLVVLVAFVPIPLNTTTEGIVWVPDRAFVRAGTDGFVDRLLIKPGNRVRKGDALVECSDPLLPAQINVFQSKIRELKAIYDQKMIEDRVKAIITKEEIENVTAQLNDALERVRDLTIRSSADGVFIMPMAQDFPGRFVRRGELLGYVLDRSSVTSRVVVSQSEIDLVRQKTKGVQIRFPDNLLESLPVVLQREVPAATDQLPGRTLSQEGGGEIAIDPRDMSGVKAFQKIFLFDVGLPMSKRFINVGGRVHVRFSHGKEPIIWRWYRGLRELFLSRFDV